MSFPRIQFSLILDTYFERYGKVEFDPLFGMDRYQIWSHHVIQRENFSFSYLEYCCLQHETSNFVTAITYLLLLVGPN